MSISLGKFCECDCGCKRVYGLELRLFSLIVSCTDIMLIVKNMYLSEDVGRILPNLVKSWSALNPLMVCLLFYICTLLALTRGIVIP